MEQHPQSFLGRGWSFPPKFDERQYTIAMVEEEEDIRQSLRILFSTLPGERLMKPDYGCDLHSQVFQEIDSSTISIIKDLISSSILDYEPRITLEAIDIDTREQLDGKLYISLVYIIRKINVRSNIVYPFYFLEGTDVTDL